MGLPSTYWHRLIWKLTYACFTVVEWEIRVNIFAKWKMSIVTKCLTYNILCQDVTSIHWNFCQCWELNLNESDSSGKNLAQECHKSTLKHFCTPFIGDRLHKGLKLAFLCNLASWAPVNGRLHWAWPEQGSGRMGERGKEVGRRCFTAGGEQTGQWEDGQEAVSRVAV